MQEKNSGAYLFVCFQNDENGKDIEKLFYGISLDGYNFKALNKTSSLTKERGLPLCGNLALCSII